MIVKIKNFLHTFILNVVNKNQKIFLDNSEYNSQITPIHFKKVVENQRFSLSLVRSEQAVKNQRFYSHPLSYREGSKQDLNHIPTFDIKNHIFNKKMNDKILFQHTVYSFQQRWLKYPIYVHDKYENLIFYVENKSTKILEDIQIISDKNNSNENKILKPKFSKFVIFSDKSKTNELLKLINFAGKYHIYDSVMHKIIGSIKQKSGFLKSEWIFYSNNNEHFQFFKNHNYSNDAFNQKIGKVTFVKKITMTSIIGIIYSLISAFGLWVDFFGEWFGFINIFIGLAWAWTASENYIITSSDDLDVAKIEKQFNIFTFKYDATLTILQIDPNINQKFLVSMGILITNSSF